MNKEIEIFDSHLHIIDPQYPLIPNKGYIPEPFTCSEYLARVSSYSLTGGAIVSGSFQAFDQSYLLSALNILGSNYVGVTQLPSSVSDEEILELNDAGVRALRFNLFRGGSEAIEYLVSMANRVYELAGWHIELYIDSSELKSLSSTLSKLPSVSIDHLGLKKAGFSELLRLVEKGVKVKATGFGRIDFDPRKAILEIYNTNPESLMFGTDLPSTRAPKPFQHTDIQLIIETLGDQAAKRVLSENANRFYKKLSS